MRLLLASKSAARRAMLKAAAVPFEVVEARLDEEAAKLGLVDHDAKGMAHELARLKACAVESGEGDLVLGSDQTLERADGSMLSKPETREEALTQLKSLGGTTHALHSAAVIAEAGEMVWSAAETVKLTMRPLSDAFLDSYLDEEWEKIRWGVGGYHVEARGVQLFERIVGSHFAVLGLPLLPLLAYLRKRGVIPA